MLKIMKKEKILELSGANMDIDLTTSKQISWKQDSCPWNLAEDNNQHKCAVKNISICKYFRGIKVAERKDIVICAYQKP